MQEYTRVFWEYTDKNFDGILYNLDKKTKTIRDF